jgi:hypothetical protein
VYSAGQTGQTSQVTYTLPDTDSKLRTLDWAIRYCCPLALDRIGESADAEKLRSLTPIINGTLAGASQMMVKKTAAAILERMEPADGVSFGDWSKGRNVLLRVVESAKATALAARDAGIEDPVIELVATGTPVTRAVAAVAKAAANPAPPAPSA